MLPYIVFLAVVMIALGVIGTTIEGMFFLTVVAAICLGLTVVLGVWTMARRRDNV